MDHAQLVHSQWLHAAECGMTLFIKRVSTHDNISDLPSRWARPAVLPLCIMFCLLCVFVQEFRVLEAAGVVEVPPVWRDAYMQPTEWEVLQERWAL